MEVGACPVPPESPRDVALTHVDYLSVGAIGFDTWLLEKPVDAKAFQPRSQAMQTLFRENPAGTRGKATHGLSYAFTLSAEGTHPSRRRVKGIVRCTLDRMSEPIHVFEC